MAEETVNQEQTAQQPETRTFSQAEVDAIIGDRLKREREKYADYEALKEKASKYDAQEEASKTDLQKAEERAAQYKTQLEALQKDINTRNARDKVSAETGVPANLLTGDTEEACKAQADAILQWRGEQPKYPSGAGVGGEPPTGSGGSTRDQFADWASAMLKKSKGEFLWQLE